MPSPRRKKPQRNSPSPTPFRRWHVVGICVFLAVITWFVFAQTAGHEFINYDDQVYVQKNTHINRGLTWDGIVWVFTHSHSANWHPLTSMSHMLDCQLFGLNAGAHHLMNVLFHTIAVILLFLVLREMTGSFWRSAFVAAIFAIHPLHVESVAWVAERKDVLSAIFFMLVLGAYVRYVRKPSPARYVVMSILFVLGLMSKSMLVTLPFVFLLLDYWPLQRIADLRDLRRVILEKIPLFVIASASCVATFLAQTHAMSSLENVPLSQRTGNAAVSILTYVRQTMWPVKLAAFYPHPLDQLPPGMVVLSVATVIAISVVALIVGWSHKYVFVGWFWYLGMLVPVLGLVQVGSQAHADRYTYLPQIGLALMTTWGIVDFAARWRYRPQILGASALLVIIVLMSCARMQAAVWHDTETLWKHAIQVVPRNHFAYSGLAEIELARGQVDKAIAHFQTAVEIYPENFTSHTKLGLLLLQTGHPSAAIAHWKIALELAPHDFNTQCNLAWVFATCPNPVMRDGPRAVALMEDVIQRSGTRTPILLRTLAAGYAESDRFPEAIRTAQEALDVATKEGNVTLAAQLREAIDTFQTNMPLRDPSLANAEPLREP